jgi:hypothetical protein
VLNIKKAALVHRFVVRDFYSAWRSDGSMGCANSQSFIVLRGFAFPQATPGESGEDGSCAGAQYGALDGIPVAIVQEGERAMMGRGSIQTGPHQGH